ncbi:MAG TPA: ATP-binding protein, partial [Thermodesulfobacteriota bacterium]|nr:ATP-binding protein [Thermodesulfobacteriota bacterium]
VGLRTEIVASIAVVLVAALLLVGLVVMKVIERIALDQQVRFGEAVLLSLQQNLLRLHPAGVPRLTAAHAELLERLAALHATGGQVLRVVVVDPAGTVLADTDGTDVGRRSRDPDLAAALAERRRAIRFHAPGRLFNVADELVLAAPLAGPGGELAGAAQVTLSLRGVQESLARARALVVLYALVDSALLILFGSYLLTRRVVTPVRRLADTTRRIAQGNFTEYAPVESANELGQLAASFNAMIDALADHRRRLEEQVASTERMNRELKQAQEEVIRSEKLASVGRLAAGVAHEIGNPLGAILGYVDILQKGSQGEEAADCLRRIEAETRRIQRIITDLLRFSRPSPVEVVPSDLNAIVRDTVDLLAPQPPFRGIEVGLELAEPAPVVLVDRHLMQQVLINLALNAADAMPARPGGGARGRLAIATRVARFAGGPAAADAAPRRSQDPPEVDFSHLRRSPTRPRLRRGQPVGQLVVRDTGHGIRPEDLGRIFDPFFTTKPPGQGTGLGLAISLRIVDSFGGQIEVDSTPGAGTTVTVSLPLAETRAERGAGGPARAAVPAGA